MWADNKMTMVLTLLLTVNFECMVVSNKEVVFRLSAIKICVHSV